MPDPVPAPKAATFDDVLAAELADVKARREASCPDVPSTAGHDGSPRERALDSDLVGLALSGGGIRSATFALGVIQGLAQLKMLKYFDYLSSVSGGGYVASWLTAWIKRDGDLANVEKLLSPNRTDQAKAARPAPAPHTGTDPEPSPLAHLRAYGSYLTPWSGLFTPDTWTLFAIYFRNLLINLCVLVPATAFAVLLPRWVTWLYSEGGFVGLPLDSSGAAADFGSFLLALILAAGCTAALWPRDDGKQRPDLLAAVLLALCIVALSLLAAGGQRDYAVFAVPALVAAWWVVGKFSTLRRATHPIVWFAVRVLFPVAFAGGLAFWFLSHRKDAHWQDARAVVLTLAATAALTLGGYNLVSVPCCADVVPWYRRFRPGLLLPLLFVAVLACWLLGEDPTVAKEHPPLRYAGYVWFKRGLDEMPRWLPPALAYAVPMAAFGLAISFVSAFRRFGLAVRPTAHYVFSGLLAAGVGGAGLYYVLNLFVWPFAGRPRELATFGPPLVLALMGLTGYVHVAVTGRLVDDQERERRSRLGGYLMLAGLAWLLAFGASLYLPELIRGLRRVNVAAVAAWLAATFGGAMAARRGPPSGALLGLLTRALVAVAPPAFLLGLVAVVSYSLDEAIRAAAPADVRQALPVDAFRPDEFDLTALVWLTFGTFAAASVLMALIDVNLFSLHELYANRLTRCYLGATRARKDGDWPGTPVHTDGKPRRQDPVTGMDADDDMPLADLAVGLATPPAPFGRLRCPNPYRGPVLLVNSALNVVGGADLALRDRKGMSFTLSARFCGCPVTGYAPTPSEGERLWNLTLGRAMAISGAAVDPNMSFYQSAQLTAFLTVLNARLGYWIENPKREEGEKEQWAAAGPAYGTFLLSELLGRTDADSRYVHLSDGGHFENTGAYELVRRRCRHVVVCDAGEDVADASENLANLIRLCRIDFGIRIEIDPTPLRRGENGLSRWHCAVGRIRYDDVDDDAVAGTLVYLRVSMTGDEPPDVRNYSLTHPEFPNQTTADQMFDEAQLESYRALGHHIAYEAFAEAAADLQREPARATHRQRVRGLFARVRNRWFPPPPDFDAHYAQTARDCVRLLGQLRGDPHLLPLCESLYPEAVREARSRAPALFFRPSAPMDELLAVNQMIAVMELAWMGGELDGYYAHPLNRGWMDAMHRWSAAPAFQRHWPLLRAEYGKGFVRFCERALCLQRIPPKLVPVAKLEGDVKEAVEILSREFGQECSRETFAALDGGVGGGLYGWVEATLKARPEENRSGAARTPPAWLVTLGKAGAEAEVLGEWAAADYPCGVVLVRDLGGARYELLVWMRGAHRSLGLGREAVMALWDELRARYGGLDVKLAVRHPTNGTGSGDRLQRAMWLSFFHDFDFRHVKPKDGRLIELERRPPA